MKALFQAAADIILAFGREAKKQRFTVLLLLIVCGIFLWLFLEAKSECRENVAALEHRFDASNKSWSDALNMARTDFLECDLKRQELSIKVAELSVKVQSLSRKR